MNDGDFIRSHLLERLHDVRCAISTRNGTGTFAGNMSFQVGDHPETVEKNRRAFFAALGVPVHRVAVPKQCHSSQVTIARSPGSFDSTDAIVTNVPDLWLVVSVADCVPVFLVDPKRKAVGVVHAGWRGTAAFIVDGVVKTMISEYESNPGDIVTFIGPAAGVCCYEVGPDVSGNFHPSVVDSRESKIFLDLKKENRRQLLKAGILERNIETYPSCTICHPELFHSYRRDGKRSGRMMGVIGIVNPESESQPQP